MKLLLRRLFERPAPPCPPAATAEVLHPAATPVETKPPIAAVEKPKEHGTGDARAKLEAARCDLHALYPLLSAIIELDLPFDSAAVQTASVQPRPKPPKMKVMRCTRPQCERQYTSEFGYFRFVPGQPSEIGELKTTPSCDIGHELRYMLLTKIGGEFLWSCPEDGCSRTIPYVETLEVS